MSNITDKTNAEYYLWGDNCEGWHLLKREDLSIITERVPPGASERSHYHQYARQFFYILAGTATIEVDGELYYLQPQQGIEIPPGVVHQFRNESNTAVDFLVISQPKSHGDRIDTIAAPE